MHRHHCDLYLTISAARLCVMFDLGHFQSPSELLGISWPLLSALSALLLPSGTSRQLFFWMTDLSNEHYWDVHIIKLGFYLGHLKWHLLAIFLQDVCQQAQGPLPGNKVLLLHLRPQRFCLLPVVCLLWKQQETKQRRVSYVISYKRHITQTRVVV